MHEREVLQDEPAKGEKIKDEYTYKKDEGLAFPRMT